MSSPIARRALLSLVLVVIAVARLPAAKAQTWDGGGANNNWTNGLNWAGDVAPVNNGTANIVMAGVVRLTPTVDLAQDIRTLTFNNTAGAFTISGQQLTISGGGGITNNDANTQTINSNIVVGAAQNWNASAGPLVVAGNISPGGAFDLFVTGPSNTALSGAISGTLGLAKNGTGTLTLSGTSANSFSRDTTINSGTLFLGKTAGLNAIAAGTVTVGDTIGAANDDVLRLGAANQIANTVNLVIEVTGLFDLNSFNETLGGTLTLNGGNLTAGAGTLTLAGNVIVNTPALFTATSTISGNLALSGQRSFTVSDGLAAIDLDIPATISGGGMIKAGAGTMRLGAGNTMSGTFRIDAGTVNFGNGGAFGTGTVEFNGGVIDTSLLNLTVTNNFIIGGNVGFGTAGGTLNTEFSGNFTLSGGDRTITSEAGIGAVISGSIGQDVAGCSLTKNGNGGLQFIGSSANTYTGTTTVNAGGLFLNKSGAANGAVIGNLVIGDGTGTDSVNIGGSEQINNNSTVTINSSGQLNITTSGVTETLSNVVFNGGQMSATGSSVFVITGSIAKNATANTATIGTGVLSLNGATIPFNVDNGTATNDLDVSASVQNGSLTKNGLGTMRFTGTAGNTYSGTTTVNAGTLALNKTSANAIAGPLVIGDGAGGPGSDVVRLDQDSQIQGLHAVVINESGLLALNNHDQNLLIGITLTGGNVSTGTGTLSVGGLVTSSISGQTATISGNLDAGALFNGDLQFDVADGAAPIDLHVSAAILPNGIGGMVKSGAGALKLSGTNTYTGDTVLNLGVLEVAANVNLGAAAGGLTFNGGTLRTTASFAIGRSIVIGSGGGVLETLGVTTLTGPIVGAGDLTKTGPGTLVLNTFNAQLGATLSLDAGDLRLLDGAVLNVTDDATVNSGALLILDNGADFTSGLVDNGGEIVLDGPSVALDASVVSNSGLLRGRGRIDAPLNNLAAGEVRAATGDLLQFTDAAGSANSARINLLGGTIEFTQSALTNNSTGQILGGGSLIANSISNSGNMAFSGAANLLGDVTNNSGARIISSGGGPTAFFDDVINNGEIRTSPGGFTVFFGALGGTGTFTGTGTVNIEGDLSPGSEPASVTFGGDVIFGALSNLEIQIGGTAPGTQHDRIVMDQVAILDGTLNVALVNGFVPQPGATFEIIRADQVAGTFSNVTFPAAPTLPWGIEYGSDSVRAFVAVPADLDVDNDVDSNDLALLSSCRTRDKVPHNGTPLCQTADLDDDGDVDPNDFGRFQRCYSGAGVPPPAGCVE